MHYTSLLLCFLLCFVYVESVSDITPDNLRKLGMLVNEQLGLSDDRWISLCSGHCLPKLIRLSFHMCVGGCNGCLNTEFGSNAGLTGIVSLLDNIYTSWNVHKMLTRADFWAFACNEAILHAASKAGASLNIPFRFGRKSCAKGTSFESTEHSFPSPDQTCQQAMQTTNVFGLTQEETVALIGGAHALGRASSSFSGWEGQFTSTPTTLSNDIFNRMVSRGHEYFYTKVGSVWQFNNAFDNTMLLQTDMCLYRDTTFGWNRLGSNGVISGCQFGNCAASSFGKSSTAHIVERYAASQEDFHANFAAAWKKMIEHTRINGVRMIDVGTEKRYPDGYFSTTTAPRSQFQGWGWGWRRRF